MQKYHSTLFFSLDFFTDTNDLQDSKGLPLPPSEKYLDIYLFFFLASEMTSDPFPLLIPVHVIARLLDNEVYQTLEHNNFTSRIDTNLELRGSEFQLASIIML